MTENFAERINNAINDIEKIQILFQQRYGEECILDKEIEEVLRIAKRKGEELEQYRKIGTVEECKEAVEKRRAKNPIDVHTEGFRYTDTYRCPSCGDNFTGTGIADYCYHCGQAISWDCLLKEYEETGTANECKEAVRRQQAELQEKENKNG